MSYAHCCRIFHAPIPSITTKMQKNGDVSQWVPGFKDVYVVLLEQLQNPGCYS